MIPADHITFDGDTAWWVQPRPPEYGPDDDTDFRQTHDRPCDTCDGTHRRQIDRFGNVWGDRLAEAMSTIIMGDIECPDCIDGRHAFDIEVAWQTEVDAYESQTYRVSIVPGMVLPLLDGDIVHEVYPPNGIYWSENQGWWADSDFENIITLPPAAAPGMWAVKLKVS